MQDLARKSTAGTSYVAADITSQLAKSAIREQWFFDLLDANLNWKADLSPYVDWGNAPVVAYDVAMAVKRTLTMTLIGNPPISQLSDLIRARYQLAMPDGGYVDFSLGIFELGIPERKIARRATTRVIAGGDLAQLLSDDKFTASYAVGTGTTYTAAIKAIVAGYTGATRIPVLMDDPGKSLPAPLVWEAGLSRLRAINDLLQAVNFVPAWFDEMGQLRSSAIPDYSQVQPSYVFDTRASVGLEIQERIDRTKAFNWQQVKVEDARLVAQGTPPIFQEYKNTRPESPVSIGVWRPVMAPIISDSSIVDAATALARAKSSVQEAARIYSRFALPTFGWAFGQDGDVYGLIYNNVDEGTVSANYQELAWRYTCKAGVPTSHEFIRVVPA